MYFQGCVARVLSRANIGQRQNSSHGINEIRNKTKAQW